MLVGFDIGGTFTDVIALTDGGAIRHAKLLSITATIGEALGGFIDWIDVAEGVDRFIHATTTASNAVIERKVARTGLLTTCGFRDDLEMRGQRRPGIYDINWDRLPPLVERHLRLEVDERILSDGCIDRPLDEKGAVEAIHALVEAGVEAIAVCLINAYVNPRHEARLKELVAQIAPDLTCCLSSEIDPEPGETERASTTVVNASLIPVFDRYMHRLQEQLGRHNRQLHIMQSNGGILTAEAACARPARLIESGPAAGVLAASHLARALGLDKVLSFDLGGTTAKACLIENGHPLEKKFGEVGGAGTGAMRLFGNGGHIVRMPWLDIVEVGAGGGSIAWIDHGVMKVGPRSAGAEPGPICYGRGGTQPTLTDAHVVLGTINPVAIADGTIAIDGDAAFAGIERVLARPLGISVLEAAHGMTRIANATMMRALRAVSTERGRDPRQFTLVAAGGGGALHAAALAEMLGIRTVCVPPFPGLFSALGLMLADFSQDYVHSVGRRLDDIAFDAICADYARMETQAAGEAWAAEGQGPLRFDRQLVVQYRGQSHLFTIAWPDAAAVGDFRAAIAASMAQEHRRLFAHANDEVIEIASLRLRATRSASRIDFRDIRPAPPATRSGARERDVYFGKATGIVRTPILSRQDVTGILDGPLILEEPDTTVLVPVGWRVERDGMGNLLLTHSL